MTTPFSASCTYAITGLSGTSPDGSTGSPSGPSFALATAGAAKATTPEGSTVTAIPVAKPPEVYRNERRLKLLRSPLLASSSEDMNSTPFRMTKPKKVRHTGYGTEAKPDHQIAQPGRKESLAARRHARKLHTPSSFHKTSTRTLRSLFATRRLLTTRASWPTRRSRIPTLTATRRCDCRRDSLRSDRAASRIGACGLFGRR